MTSEHSQKCAWWGLFLTQPYHTWSMLHGPTLQLVLVLQNRLKSHSWGKTLKPWWERWFLPDPFIKYICIPPIPSIHLCFTYCGNIYIYIPGVLCSITVMLCLLFAIWWSLFMSLRIHYCILQSIFCYRGGTNICRNCFPFVWERTDIYDSYSVPIVDKNYMKQCNIFYCWYFM